MQATTLPLVLPSAIVFDAQGNLYFAETGNHVIRRLSPVGILTTVAGSGVQGFSGDGGPALAAALDSPAGLALNAAGDLYIADSHNQRIREVAAATGTISTIAGAGTPGFSGDGGAAASALLALPTALALDTAGNVYVADTGNHRVRRIAAATGVITTVAGNGVQGFSGDHGAATAASIDSPNGLALDPAGNLYLADTHNGRVREVNAATGVISSVAGTSAAAGGFQPFGGDGGPASAATLALPRGLTMDAMGNLYVADSANHRIRRISTAGVITTIAGQGTQTFAGDGTPAVTASLDTPRSIAISPAGLATLADTGNQRIRQVDALPTPGPDIQTIAGLGITTPGALSLSAPSVVAYGSGAITATLTTATPATGSITFLDTKGGTMVTLGVAGLTAASATLNTSAMAAGAHSIVAIYGGDSTHAPVQSPALALAVTPLAVTAVANPAAILYGQPVPTLNGVLSGVIPQDANNVAPVFVSSAAALSPVGLYPIAATLTGSAAANYTVAAAPAIVRIGQAPTRTVLSPSTSATTPGLPVTLNIQAATTTSGVPTGSVTLLDGIVALSVLPLSATGGAVLTTSTLPLGSHNITAVYSGDANFLPSISTIATVGVSAASDFTLASTSATAQSIPRGSAVTFTFSVAIQGAAMASPITLAVQGVPLGSTSSLNPPYLPPGGAVTSFTLTIQTPIATLEKRTRPFAPGPWDYPEFTGSGLHTLLAILLLPAIGLARRRPLNRCTARLIRHRRRSPIVLAVVGASSILIATFATGCGDRVNAGSESATAATYMLTVTGTATGPAGTALQHSANVTLQIL